MVRCWPYWWHLTGQIMELQRIHGRTLRGVQFKIHGLVHHPSR